MSIQSNNNQPKVSHDRKKVTTNIVNFNSYTLCLSGIVNNQENWTQLQLGI